MTVEDPWAWLDEAEPDATLDTSGHRVTAIMVVHNGATWLPATLESLSALTTRPDRLLAVDAGSTDGSAELLTGTSLFEQVISTGADSGFGGAVAAALQSESGPAPTSDTEWLWLLHDDITVAPDALAQLLQRVAADPEVALVGPKLLQAGRGGEPPSIAEIGVSISDTGRIDPQTDPGEIDQHQHKSEQVLAVNSCAMLVRRTVFDELGGFSPEVPVFTDGLEFGWRATEAGHRVVTAPKAAIVHRRAGHTGLRASPLIAAHPERTERLMAMRTVAGHRTPASSVRLLWGSVLRALGFLLGKAPERAADELAAATSFLGGGAVRRLRSRRRTTETGRSTAAALRPARWSNWQVGAEAVGTSAGQRWRELVGERGTDTSIDELTGGDFSGSDHPTRSNWFGPFGVSLVVLLVLALVAARDTVASGRLASTLLLPSRVGLGDAFAAYLAPIAGSPGISAPPWLGWVALGSTIALGRPEFFSTIAIVLAPPLAMVTGFLLLRRIVSDRRIAVVAALFNALVPVLIGATGRGALAASVFAVMLPLFVICARSVLVGRSAGAANWRGVFAGGVLLTIMVSFLPAVAAVAALAAVIGCILHRGRIVQILVLLAIPAVLLAPWLPSLRHGLSRILLGPDGGLGGTDAPAAFWHIAAGRTPGEALPPLLVGLAFFAVIWVGAIVAGAVRGFDTAVVIGWVVGAGSLLVAALLAGELATAAPFGTQVRPELATWLVIGFGGLVLAAAAGADQVPRALASRSFGVGHLVAAMSSVLVIVVLLGSAGWWVVAGDRPLHRDAQDEIAPYIRNAQTSPAQTRTLALRLDGERLSYSLVEGELPRLGDADRGFAFAGSSTMQARTSSIAARLAAGAGDAELAEELSSLAVGHIWVTGATQEQKTRIDNVPGLGSASGDERAYVWSVPGTSGRSTVEGAGEPVLVALDDSYAGETDLPAAQGPRQLVLREPSDPRWQVSHNGQRLEGVPGTDSTSYEVPADPGHLEIRLASPVRPWLALAQLVALLVLLVLAAPSVRRRQQTEPTGRRLAGRSEGPERQHAGAGAAPESSSEPSRSSDEPFAAPSRAAEPQPEPQREPQQEPEQEPQRGSVRVDEPEPRAHRAAEAEPTRTDQYGTVQYGSDQYGTDQYGTDQNSEAPAAAPRGRRVADDDDGGIESDGEVRR